jgi:hypothetical protein
MDELREDIQREPETFTEDINFMLEKYSEHLTPIL